jgi:cation:H+ antiporter
MKETLLALLVGNGLGPPLSAFLLLGAVVFLIASRLARDADLIADATGLGRLWIGSLLLAGSTSLPELLTDINAAVLGVPDIGVGDLLGSTMANMLILAGLDLAFPKRRILETVAVDHVLVATLALVLTAMTGIAITTGGWGSVGHVGVETLVIGVTYILGMRVVYRSSAASTPHDQLALGDDRRTLLRRGLAGFALAAAGMLVTAPLLVLSAEAVAVEAGLSQTAVGTLLVGFTTSFPEMASTVAAVRMGALDLAVGNIFGSNAFNMFVLLPMDLAYLPGSLLANVSSAHILSAQFALLALALGMLGILGRAGRLVALVRIESVAILAAWAGLAWLLTR